MTNDMGLMRIALLSDTDEEAAQPLDGEVGPVESRASRARACLPDLSNFDGAVRRSRPLVTDKSPT